MPLIDMPLDQLRSYQGRNPRPEDFDGYWDAALAELDATPLDPKFEPSEFALKGGSAEDLWFTGVGGARIHAKSMRPTWTQEPIPCVLFFHGYTGRAPDWWGLAPWIAAGYAVLALDCRGQAGSSEDLGGVHGGTLRGHIVRGLEDSDPRNLLFRQVFLDCAALARIALDLPGIDSSRVYATGASQGGGLTIACAALEPKVSKIAPIYPFLSDYQRTWEMDLAKDAYQELRDHFRMFDPRHERVGAIFDKLGYIDVQHLAPRIRAETLMAVGLMDTITPPSTQFAAYNKLRCRKEMVIYPDFGHEGLPEVGDCVLTFFERTNT